MVTCPQVLTLEKKVQNKVKGKQSSRLDRSQMKREKGFRVFPTSDSQ